MRYRKWYIIIRQLILAQEREAGGEKRGVETWGKQRERKEGEREKGREGRGGGER